MLDKDKVVRELGSLPLTESNGLSVFQSFSTGTPTVSHW